MPSFFNIGKNTINREQWNLNRRALKQAIISLHINHGWNKFFLCKGPKKLIADISNTNWCVSTVEKYLLKTSFAKNATHHIIREGRERPPNSVALGSPSTQTPRGEQSTRGSACEQGASTHLHMEQPPLFCSGS